MIKSGRSALLVVDMQVGVMRGCTDVAGVLARTGTLVDRARALGAVVVWIQDEQDFPRHSDDWQLAPPLEPGPQDVHIFKNYRDSFADTSLAGALQAAGVSRVVVTGTQSDFCVRTAAQRAAADGYHLSLVSDCHTTRDAEFAGSVVTGEQIIAQTNLYFSGLRYPGVVVDLAEHDAIRW